MREQRDERVPVVIFEPFLSVLRVSLAFSAGSWGRSAGHSSTAPGHIELTVQLYGTNAPLTV